MTENLSDLNQVMTEPELLEMFGLKRGYLDKLRLAGKMPFYKMSARLRLYNVKDVLSYIDSKKVTLNQAEVSDESEDNPDKPSWV